MNTKTAEQNIFSAAAKSKYQQLLSGLSQLKGGLLVCFSGGVDSSLLLRAAKQAGVSPLLALLFSMPTSSEQDRQQAQAIAAEIDAELLVYQLDTLLIPALASNSRERCYHCKLAIFNKALSIAKKRGISTVADGSNADDMTKLRPGNKAAAELNIRQPLAEHGLSKSEVREAAKMLHLSNHALPSSPCLASRFPYDTQLSRELLRRVEEGEALLHSLGIADCRLRVHGDLCRIEVPALLNNQLLANKDLILTSLQELGWRYITLDLAGLISGNFDR